MLTTKQKKALAWPRGSAEKNGRQPRKMTATSRLSCASGCTRVRSQTIALNWIRKQHDDAESRKQDARSPAGARAGAAIHRRLVGALNRTSALACAYGMGSK
eukprot:1534467-Prymnesium_polylepis.1